MQRKIVALPRRERFDGQKLGLLTRRQYLVLKNRIRGLSQLETAMEMKTSRANVSMIELRARNKIKGARDTIKAYESILSSHSVLVRQGTKLQEIPSIVLREGDKYGIHLRSNLVEIIRMVKAQKNNPVRDGKTIRKLKFTFTQTGKLSIS